MSVDNESIDQRVANLLSEVWLLMQIAKNDQVKLKNEQKFKV